MEPKKKIPLSFNNNIQRNLFPKTLSFTENKKNPSKERQKNSDETKQKSKLVKSFIYFHKIATMENKKENSKSKIPIDSRSEARLPQGYIDLSYDNPKNE